MYQNTIYIFISWYSKICWFPLKKCWYQQNSRGVSRDSYIFWIFFGQGITVPSFIIVWYLWQILGREGLFASPHPWAVLKKPILNRVKLCLSQSSCFIATLGPSVHNFFQMKSPLKQWSLKRKTHYSFFP